MKVIRIVEKNIRLKCIKSHDIEIEKLELAVSSIDRSSSRAKTSSECRNVI